jgi:hypothetical protein
MYNSDENCYPLVDVEILTTRSFVALPRSIVEAAAEVVK